MAMDSTPEVDGHLTEQSASAVPASNEFRSELNATLDEFFVVIQQSNARLAELVKEVVKRDTVIALLETENSALKARLGIAEVAAPEKIVSLNLGPPKNLADPAPIGPGPARSIWHRLSKLDSDL